VAACEDYFRPRHLAHHTHRPSAAPHSFLITLRVSVSMRMPPCAPPGVLPQPPSSNLLSLVHGTRRQLSSMYTARLSRATSDRASGWTRRCYRTHLLHCTLLRCAGLRYWPRRILHRLSPASISRLIATGSLKAHTSQQGKKRKRKTTQRVSVSASGSWLYIVAGRAGWRQAGRQALALAVQV
jgi:hypothetical protein